MHDVATGAREVSCLGNSLGCQEILEKQVNHANGLIILIDE